MRISKTYFALVPALLIFLFAVSGALGFFNAGRYNDVDSSRRFLKPGAGHILGTDNLGRDVFSRIAAGAGHTLFTALATVALSCAAGTAAGLAAGFSGPFADEIIMRLMDTISAFPGILLALAMTALFNNSGEALIPALTVLFIPSFTRIARSGALEFGGRDFVLMAALSGAGRARILFVEILPNMAPRLLSATVLGLSNAILAEAAMSYLGLGIQPPLPSWGRMLSESQNFLFNAPFCALAPGFCIMFTVISFHMLGEALKHE